MGKNLKVHIAGILIMAAAAAIIRGIKVNANGFMMLVARPEMPVGVELQEVRLFFENS